MFTNQFTAGVIVFSNLLDTLHNKALAMNKTFLLYANECINLARSLIIKSSSSAASLNTALSNAGVPVDEDDPSTWKYYLNLQGLYHPNDKPLTVVSSDDRSTVQFDRTTLLDHPITMLNYRLGGRFYKELMDGYPQHRTVINGVNTPVSFSAAYNAKDFTILGYDSRFMNVNEDNLISSLQQWINQYVERWYNPDYKYTDKLYDVAFLGTMIPHLVPMIMLIRLSNARTPQVGNYHLWNYLADHYDIDHQSAHLTRKQALYLSRNIESFRINAGRKYVLTSLIDNLIIPKSLVASRYDMVHQNDLKLSTGKPKIRYSRTAYDKAQTNTDNSALITAPQLLQLTYDRRPDNASEFDIDSEELSISTLNTLYGNENTPILSITEDVDLVISIESSNQLKMDYWIYLSYLGLYNPDISFRLPNEDYDIFMTAKEAAILLFYALNRSSGIDQTYIPPVRVYNVIPVTYPTAEELLPFTDRLNVTLEDLQVAGENLLTLDTVKDITELEAFIEKVRLQRIRHELLWNSKNDSFSNAVYRGSSGGYWISQECELAPPNTRYNDWLDEHQINKFDLTIYGWAELANNILEAGANIIVDENSLSPGKSAMVEIVDNLTSYSLLIAPGEGTADYRSLPWGTNLIDSIEGSLTNFGIIPYGIRIEQGTEKDVGLKFDYEIDNGTDPLAVDGPITFTGEIEFGLTIEDESTFTDSRIIDIGFNSITDISIKVTEE